MAKHLKLNIKNSQLAEMMREKKQQAAKKKEKAARQAELAAPKLQANNKPDSSEIKTEEIKVLPTTENVLTSVKPSSEKSPAERSNIQNIPDATVTRIDQTQDESAKPDPSAETEKPTDGHISLIAKPKKILPSANQTGQKKGLKDFQKRSSSAFDSRHKQGLKVDEEKIWRKRPKRIRVKPNESEIIRPKSLSIRVPISIKDLAQEMKRKASELISKLFLKGIKIQINDFLDDETTIGLLGYEFECDITIDTSEEKRLNITSESVQEEIENSLPKELSKRPPVIAFMGHVDHGKTSLVDYIRKSKITEGEAGSITQHLGAFQSESAHGKITILDTPGHKAFSLMRQRGTAITDIIVLVIAGDEGIMPQTQEAIDLAKEKNITIVAAINKCDKEGFDPDTVYRQLADQNFLPEAWGGSTITINCSAVTGEGVETLLEMLSLQAELMELKANKDQRARGMVIESQMHKGLGPRATVLVQNGTLKKGDAIVFDDLYARVKTMHNDLDQLIDEAPPSTPVKITGLSGIPNAGSDFIVVGSEKEARKLATERVSGAKHKKLQTSRKELESYVSRHQELTEKKILPLIIKADVQGSVEAIKASLEEIPSTKVELNFISEGVGEISESDIELAAASGATIIGFHTHIESHAMILKEKHQVTVKQRNIIYQLVDDVTNLMLATLDKVRHETHAGTAKVQQIFKSSQIGSIAGSIMLEGTLRKSQIMKVMRDGKIIHEGPCKSLKRVKEDIKEVSKGNECGIVLQRFDQWELEDLIQGYDVSYINQTLVD